MRGKEYKKILALIAIATISVSMGGAYKANAFEIDNVASVVSKTSNVNLPSKYEAKSTVIKNQGIDGVCWSFAGMATLENYLLKNNIGDYDFSEEYMKWYATSDSSGNGWQLKPDGGAPNIVVPGLMVSGKGPINESQMKYDVNNLTKKPDNLNSFERQIDVSAIEYIPNDMKAVKEAIYNYGAVQSNMYVSNEYQADNYKSYYCNVETNCNHAITIVGWDDNYSKDNFNESNKPTKDGAWLVKNSSGENIGDKGYIWISYEDKNVLTTKNGNLNYTVRSAQKHDSNKKIYQYDEYGATSDFQLGNKPSDITYANVFNFEKEYNKLESVIFETSSVGSKYVIYYIPTDEKNNMIQDKKEKLAEGTVEYNGYICADVKGFSLNEGQGAIAVQMIDEQKNGNTSIGYERDVNVNGNIGYKAVSNKNESFIILNGYQYDITEDLGSPLNANLSIKAVAVKDSKPEEDKKDESTITPDKDEDKATGTPSDNKDEDKATGTPSDNKTPDTSTGTVPTTTGTASDKDQKPTDDSESGKTSDPSSIPVAGIVLGTLGSFFTLLKKKK